MIEQTYIGGAGEALETVERLMLRACSRTLDLASMMEGLTVAAEERQRTKVIAALFLFTGA